MKERHETGDADSAVFSRISAQQIESVNFRRVMSISLGTLAFEVINLFNPNFWLTPILWLGAIYLSVVSAGFVAVLLLKKPAALLRSPDVFNALFWTMFTVGFFPFLVRDAWKGDSPLNCVLLCTVLICAPLLQVGSLRVIFGTALAVNLLAAWYAQGRGFSFMYAVELLAINAVGYFMARNLHGRYFALLDSQQRLYDQQLVDKLAQEELQLKLEQDRRVNADRSEFLSRMSHDLRTPLNAIIGLSGIAMDESLTPRQVRAYLGDINGSAGHLLSLVNDVLDISKLENGKMTLHPEPCGTDEFLNTVQSIIGAQCAQRGIRFSAVCGSDVPGCLLVDKLRFNQVFLNLLSNAMKFTPAGGEVSLRMTYAPRPDGSPCLTAVVQDTGRGMTPKFAAHAFDAFSQQNAEDAECVAGLGLTIVKSIVELMQGSIRIDSQPGCGTRVTVELPAAQASRPAGQQDSAAVEAALRGRRVLLCEDHPLNQTVAVCLLEKAGMQVEVAANGQEGVTKFAQSPHGYYNAVLMDVRMPVMDGLAAARAIRALPRADAGTVPIIAMTANAYGEDIDQTRAAGMDAHLCKPVDPAALYGTLARFMSGAAPAGQPRG